MLGSTPDISEVYPKTGLDIDLAIGPPYPISSGSCLFDGSDDFVNCGDHANSQMASGDFSVVYWAKTTGTAETFIVSKQDGASAYDGYRFGFEGTNYRFRVSDGTTGIEVDGAAVVNDGKWHHFAFTVDRSGNLLAYVDGQLDKTTDITSINNAIDPDEDLILGASYSGGSQNFGGNACNVGIYKGTVLTQAQVRSIMLATSYAATAAVVTPSLFYLLQDNYNDSTGNQNGTNNGSTLTGTRCHLPYGLTSTDNRHDARLYTGRGIDFDGTGDFISLGHPDDLDGFFNTGGTVSMWVNMTSTATFERLFDFGTGTNLYLQGSFGGYVFNKDYGTTNGVWTYNGNGGVELGEWFHLCLSYNAASTSNNPDLYINGVLQTIDGETTPVGSLDAETSEKRIGADGSGTSPLDASLAHVKFITSTVTAAQALELYQNPEQVLPTGISASALKCFLPLSDYDIPAADNSLNGLVAFDASGNGNNGDITNCGMVFSQSGPCPQLTLQSHTSRCLFNDSNTVMKLEPSGTDIDCSGAFTLLFWCQTFSTNLDARLWDATGDGTNGPMVFVDTGDSGFMRVRTKVFFDSTAYTWDTPTNVFPVNQMTHVAVTFAGGTSANIKYYINGSAVTVTNPGSSRSGTQTTDNGRKDVGGTGTSQVWDGLISECAVFAGHELDADAISVVYNGGVQGFDLLTDSGNYDQASNLDGWWRIDNSAVVTDLKGSTNGSWDNAPDMVTLPQGTTSGLSSFGNITSSTVGSFKANFPFQKNVNSTQLQGYLKHDCPTWGTGEYCVAFWLRTTHLSGGATHYFWDIRGSTNSYGMRIYASATNNILWKPKGAGSGEVAIYPAPSSGTVTDGAWHFVALQRLGASSQKWYWRRITDASFNSGTNSTAFGDMTDAGDAYINGSSSATSPSGGQIAMPKIYIGQSFDEAEIGRLFEQGKRVLLGDTL